MSVQATAVATGDPWGWVSSVVPTLLAVGTLVWTRLPEASRLRKLERLGALVKDLPSGSAARTDLQSVLDGEAANYLAVYANRARRRALLADFSRGFALITIGLVILGLSVGLASTGGLGGKPQPGLAFAVAVSAAGASVTGAALAIASRVRAAAARRRAHELWLAHLDAAATPKAPPASA